MRSGLYQQGQPSLEGLDVTISTQPVRCSLLALSAVLETLSLRGTLPQLICYSMAAKGQNQNPKAIWSLGLFPQRPGIMAASPYTRLMGDVWSGTWAVQHLQV